MKTDEIRGMSETDLHRTLDEHKQELFNLRFQLATRKTKNHQRIPLLKREVARIQTVLRERELMVQFGGAEAEEVVQAGPTLTSAQASRARRSGLLGRLRGGK